MPGSKSRGRAAGIGGLEWKVHASDGAMSTSNPIREIIETMNLAENPAKKVIPLSIGDPTIFGNLKPCQAILDAIQRANASGKFYGYQTAAGMESARKAVAKYHNKCTGNRVREQDVILASGCSHAIDLCICVLARYGQNILIPRPGFPLYKTLTSVYGVKFKQYDLLADKNWSIDLKHLESLIDADTAAIVVNNPSNPCGSVFSKRHLREILSLAERHRLPIISDEIYDKFVFSPDSYNNSEPTNGYNHEIVVRPQQSMSNGACNGSDSGNFERIELEDEEVARDDENRQPTHLGIKDGGVKGEQVWKEANERKEEEEEEEEEKREKEEEEEREGEEEEDDDDDDDSAIEDENLVHADEFRYVRFRSLASLSDTVPILTCGGISKTCLIPGLRLGWIIINDRQNIFDASIRHGLSRLTQRLMGPNSLVQGALHDILTNVPDDFYKQTMNFIFKNAKLCYERLLRVRGLHPYMPQGSMYLMVGFNAKLFPDIDGDLDFTSKLMNEQSVLVLPGKCFDFPNFFRICLTVPTTVMEDALDRIEEFCGGHSIVVCTVAPDDKVVTSDPKLNIDSGTITTKALRQQSQNIRASTNKQQYQIKHQTNSAASNKKTFELTGQNNMNGGQQLARSKCN